MGPETVHDLLNPVEIWIPKLWNRSANPMTVAVITLSREGARLAEAIVRALPEARPYVHQKVDSSEAGERFASTLDLTREIFPMVRGLVYIAPCGVAVRAVAPCLKHKTTDPAVVVVDVGGRWAVSLLSGHEGGANDLAMTVANIIGAEPVISTTTEAVKNLILGVGCRRGTPTEKIVTAIRDTLEAANLDLSAVRILSSVDIKADEAGLAAAARELGLPLRIIPSQEIRDSMREFGHSDFVLEKVNVPAVAEPCALLAGRRTRLLIPKTIHDGVTVAVAEESFL